MAASLHLGIRDAVAALLAPLAGGRVYENRDLPLPLDVESQIQVYRLESQPERNLVGQFAPIDWTTDVRIVVKARRTAAGSSEVVADDLASATYAAVMASQTLGGLCQLMDPGVIRWDQDEADTAVSVATWEVRITHRTEINTIT